MATRKYRDMRKERPKNCVASRYGCYAIGWGIAHILADQKENIKGTVYFILQPATDPPSRP